MSPGNVVPQNVPSSGADSSLPSYTWTLSYPQFVDSTANDQSLDRSVDNININYTLVRYKIVYLGPFDLNLPTTPHIVTVLSLIDAKRSHSSRQYCWIAITCRCNIFEHGHFP
ncbi:hypothetical protein LSAT2_000893 [Lamellibrachia satsuma]|nr:hypothetical protein LSAT2_000893 [Lamellibrachia satsuma]